jgi:hypothetical protein
MNLRATFKIKPLLLSWGTGTALVLVLFVLGETGIVPNLNQTLLSPGLLLAGLAGYGAHDIEAIVLAILGDSLFYGLLSFFALSIVRARWLVRNRQDPASGPANTTTTR